MNKYTVTVQQIRTFEIEVSAEEACDAIEEGSRLFDYAMNDCATEKYELGTDTEEGPFEYNVTAERTD